MAACCTYQRPSSFSCWLNKSHTKSLFLYERNWRTFWGKSKKQKTKNKGMCRKKDKTERRTRVGRRTGQETEKWNQMIALSFQTGERNNKHDRPPFGGRHRTSPPKWFCIKKVRSGMSHVVVSVNVANLLHNQNISITTTFEEKGEPDRIRT